MSESENPIHLDYQGNIADESVADEEKTEVSPAPVKMNMENEA